ALAADPVALRLEELEELDEVVGVEALQLCRPLPLHPGGQKRVERVDDHRHELVIDGILPQVKADQSQTGGRAAGVEELSGGGEETGEIGAQAERGGVRPVGVVDRCSTGLGDLPGLGEVASGEKETGYDHRIERRVLA